MSRSLASWFLAVTIAAAPLSSALAQPEEVDSRETQAQAEADIEHIRTLFEAEPVYYQITFPRVQALITPSWFLLDYFFDMHKSHWTEGQINMAFGAEFIIRHVERFDLVFSVDWADIRTPDGWWLEADKAVVNAEWIENRITLLTADVAINWLTELDRSWELYYGIGLGLALPLGGLHKSDIDPDCLRAGGVDPFRSYDTSLIGNHCYTPDGLPILDPNTPTTEEDSVPVVLPALSLNIGTRFIIQDHWPIQFEIGFKTLYFYAGLEVGYIWY